MNGDWGIMFQFNPRDYSVRELFDWYNRKELHLSPKFQRRSVWEYKAKSFLVDTILRGLPIPRIYIREKTNSDFSAIKEIVDGQQRLNAIFDFLNDGFKISKVHNHEFADKHYSELPDSVKSDFLKYPISSLLFIDLPDSDILDLFARLNTYSVKLNPQELLNSQYFGRFKQFVYTLAREYGGFWIESGVLTEREIARMGDAQLVSDLLVSIVTGQISNVSKESVYKLYDDEFPNQNLIESNFKTTLDKFAKLYDGSFSETAFVKVPLFYSTFLILYNLQAPIFCFESFGNDSITVNNAQLKTALDEINSLVQNGTAANQEEDEFLLTLKRNTTTPNVRLKRCEFIGKMIQRYGQ